MASNKTMTDMWANGASSNIFYFASLKEIKWRVFEYAAESTIPNHPIIQICREMFHEQKLVTWHLGRNGLQLWFFYWPSDECDKKQLEMLTEVDVGKWDNGLPSECLSHLYKSVYQHFERSLFNDGYARIGRYFVKADGTAQQSFQIGFFIHGEDSLCASIEPQNKLQVHFLRKNNLDSNQKLKVVLMPIGVECTLTGTFLNLINSPQTLKEVEDLFPAYEIDRNNPMLCHRLFLVELVISGYTILYPATHVLIVNDVIPKKTVRSTLQALNDELAGIISSEGEVTSASSTQIIRDPNNQQAVWKESGFWTYKPPPDCLRCEKHSSSSHSTLIESCTPITKRSRAQLHRKRLQRSVYKSYLERNKYRDDKSPVINLPTLPLKTEKASEESAGISELESKLKNSLPKLQPPIRTDLLLNHATSADNFDAQPHTIECVENTACYRENTYNQSRTQQYKMYNLPVSTSRKPLPFAAYSVQGLQRALSETLNAANKRSPACGPSDSPGKKAKHDMKNSREGSQAPLEGSNSTTVTTLAAAVTATATTGNVPSAGGGGNSNMTVADGGQATVKGSLPASAAASSTSTTVNTTTSSNVSTSQPRPKVNFTHEADIEVDGVDLEKIFESESDTDDDYKDMTKDTPLNTLDLDNTGAVVVPESCLTPENTADPKCMMSPSHNVPPNMSAFAPQSHDFPTPPSNEANSYESDSEVNQTEGKSFTMETQCDTYFQKLLDLSPYSNITINRSITPSASYRPSPRTKSSNTPIMINSPRKGQTGISKSLKDITSELEKISSELKEFGALSNASDYTRNVQSSSVIKDDITLSAIGEKLMLNPNSSFVFTNNSVQSSTKKELSNLPKFESLQFLMKFGNSPLNKFNVSTDDIQVPGWYSCIPLETRSVTLDIARMEIIPQAEHKSTVGYHPKSSISISLYQPLEHQTSSKLHNPNPFLAVQNSRFSASFLKILQQLARNAVDENSKHINKRAALEISNCVTMVGKVLKGKLPPNLVSQKSNLLLWKEFVSLADGYDVSDQPLPPVVVGCDNHWMSASPLSLPFWLYKGMEPYSGKKNVSYLVVAPENPHLINNISILLKEISSVYELSNLGHHTQLATKIRDGILRVGKKSGEKIIGETCDPWFHDHNDPEAMSWQIYAKCCHHILAKYLSNILHNIGDTEFKPIVVYIVDPFTTKSNIAKAQIITRCFNTMYNELNKIPKTQFILQCLPVTYVSDMHRNTLQINSILRNICFSIYNEALKHTKPKPLATCLTGFGPISDEAIVLEGGDQRKVQNRSTHYTNTSTVVLGPTPHSEINPTYDTLFCAYSLSHDSNWVIVSVTDSTGHMTDTAIYAIDKSTRNGAVPESVINNIWLLCLGIVENFKCLWSIVISKMGSVTDYEDQVWWEKFNSVTQRNNELHQRCTTCKISTRVQMYGIASATLTSLINPSHISVVPQTSHTKYALHTSSACIITLKPQELLSEFNDRHRKMQEDNSFTFYTSPDLRDRKKKILSSAYMASSASINNIPKHMGPGTSSMLLGNLHRHYVIPTAPKKHVLCGDNTSIVLRHILQKYDMLSWLQLSHNQRLSPLPHHMHIATKIYKSLQEITFVPSS